MEMYFVKFVHYLHYLHWQPCLGSVLRLFIYQYYMNENDRRHDYVWCSSRRGDHRAQQTLYIVSHDEANIGFSIPLSLFLLSSSSSFGQRQQQI